MADTHLCQFGALQVQLRDRDGTTVVREWTVCKHTIDALAEHLGDPTREYMFTSEAHETALAQTLAMPGVVMSEARDV